MLHSFSGETDGATPASGLLLGPDGALYGLTAAGGAQNAGVAFRLAPPEAGQSAWTVTTLHSFNGTTDGMTPFGKLVMDNDGVLYGSTNSGGSGQGGVVFSLAPPAAGQSDWTEKVLYSFQFGTDGISPTGDVFRDPVTGAITGMTSGGGLNNAGEVYQITPPAGGGASWTKATVYNFRSITDGNFPLGGLVRDQNGTFYGVTDAGGLTGWGTVFSLAPPSGNRRAWLETVIYHFSGHLDGGAPNSTPVLAPDGTLYGVTNAGGRMGSGAAFALSPPQAGKTTWTETAIASFDGPNGNNPSGLTRDPAGRLVGPTVYGGTLGVGGGTIFALTPPPPGGTAWTQTELQQFRTPSTNAAEPIGPLLLTKAGTLYGSASVGGASNQGAAFELTPPAAGETAWHETLLHSFNGADGSEPNGALIPGPKGVLYGVAAEGGDSATPDGTVYALLPPAGGSGEWTSQVLHAFTGVATGDGAFPAAGLIADASGALYGTAGSGGTTTPDNSYGNGIVYKLTPPAKGATAWTETILYSFSGPDGSSPQGTLRFDRSGALYGTTYTGGTAGEGTVFKLTPPAAGSTAWTETVLHSFDATGGNDGAILGQEQLLADAGGALYGTASQGGLYNNGVVFKLAPPTGTSTAWTETVLYNFTGGSDGGQPYVGLLARKGGGLVGVAQQGTMYRGGTVFSLTPPATGTSAWTAKILHTFMPAYGKDGTDPASPLVQDAKGDLFGTTALGGHGASGIAYELPR